MGVSRPIDSIPRAVCLGLRLSMSRSGKKKKKSTGEGRELTPCKVNVNIIAKRYRTNHECSCLASLCVRRGVRKMKWNEPGRQKREIPSSE